MSLKLAPLKRTRCRVSPICPEIACMSCMSKPVAIPFSLNSKGGSGVAEATIRVPGCNVALISHSPEQDAAPFYLSAAKKGPFLQEFRDGAGTL